MGLAINGDIVHGLAIGGQAFTSSGVPTNLTHKNYNIFAISSNDFGNTYHTAENLNKFLGHTVMIIVWDTNEGEIEVEEETRFAVCGPFVFKDGVKAIDLADGSTTFTFNSNGNIKWQSYSYQNPLLVIIDFSVN